MKEQFKGRLNLTDKASEALCTMVRKLMDSSPYVQINASKLCSWIVERYAEEYFSADAHRITKAHFSSRRFIKDKLKGANTEEEIQTALKEAMLQLGTSDAPIKRRPKKADGGGIDSSPADVNQNALTNNI